MIDTVNDFMVLRTTYVITAGEVSERSTVPMQ